MCNECIFVCMFACIWCIAHTNANHLNLLEELIQMIACHVKLATPILVDDCCHHKTTHH